MIQERYIEETGRERKGPPSPDEQPASEAQAEPRRNNESVEQGPTDDASVEAGEPHARPE